MSSNMIEGKAIRTTTKPIKKITDWQNGHTAKRLTVTTDKRIIGCMYSHKAIRKTSELTDCVPVQSSVQTNRQSYLYMLNRINRQLTALTAIGIIN